MRMYGKAVCLLMICAVFGLLFGRCSGGSSRGTVALKTADDYTFPLTDSLLAEVKGGYETGEKSRDYEAMKNCAGILVRHYGDMNDYRSMLLFINGYLGAIRAGGDSTLLSDACYTAGVAYFNSGLPDYSIDCFLQCLRYAKDDKMRGKVSYAIGENSRNLQKTDGIDTEFYYRQAESIGRSLNDSLLIAGAMFGLSQLYFDSMGNYKIAVMTEGMKDSLSVATRLLEDAVKYSGKDVNPVHLAGLCLNYAAAGQYGKALALKDTIESYRAIPKYTALTYNCLAAVGNYMKDYGEVIRLGKEAFAFASENNRKFDMSHAADIMAFAYRAKGDWQNALENIETVHRIYREFGQKESETETLALQVKHDLALKEQLIIRQHTKLQWATATAVTAVLALTVIIRFYRKKQKAYRELVRKNREWAKTDSTDTSGRTATGVEPSASEADRQLFEQLQHLCTKGYLYRENAITIDEVALRMNANKFYLSRAINRCAGKNFNGYINEYRIREAIRLMPEVTEKFTVETLAGQVGFNDRKTFYNAFKKVTGLSPSDFRKNINSSGLTP